MLLEKIDTLGKGYDRVIPELQEKRVFMILLNAYLRQIEELEVAIESLPSKFELDDLEGYWMDIVGKTLGLRRSSRDDESYLRAIKFRIATKTNGGSHNGIIRLLKIYTGASSVRVELTAPAGLRVIFDGNDSQEVKERIDRLLLTALEDIVLAGVSFEVIDGIGGSLQALPDNIPAPPDDSFLMPFGVTKTLATRVVLDTTY